jgi:hypothetical protein
MAFSKSNLKVICFICVDGILFMFLESPPKLIVGKSYFNSLHLVSVKCLKEWNVCCDIYHVELEELKVGEKTQSCIVDVHVLTRRFVNMLLGLGNILLPRVQPFWA